jgi:hypothetical protein
MADWRQIQARIRKAKNSPEAVAKLSDLFKRTRDGMVAWELGTLEEKADHKEEAGNWYILAAQRFRRADWKKKAEEALTRLGVSLPPTEATVVEPAHSEEAPPKLAALPRESEPTPPALEESSSSAHRASPDSAPAGEPGRRKRRRGRRGGRGRRRQGANAPALSTEVFSEPLPSPLSPPEATASPVVEGRAFDRVESGPPEPVRAEPPPQLPSERMAHGRSEPGLASRMAHLESLLRRLLGSPLRRLENTDEAPAGPGVFLLSDSDQTTSYYVEACQTLRVGIGNLVRGGQGGKTGRSGRGPAETNLKAKLAEHLEINEAKVSHYLKDHCVIRWIQLDDDAPLLAHFAIAVLRTPLNLV